MTSDVHCQTMGMRVGSVSDSAKTMEMHDHVSRQLGGIWQHLLGVDSIGEDENYFDLGGDSILAVQLFAQIEKVFGVKLPVATLFEAPTVAELSKILVRETPAPGWSPLVTIQPSGSRPPFFCMHGAGGNVLIYRALSLHLGLDQPFYGLQCQGLDGNSPLLETVEDMAALYMKEIRRVQPHGPYFLGGYCMGGSIAFEVARQLQSAGESIGLLALFDTMNWSKLPAPSTWDKCYYNAERIMFHLANFFLADYAGKTKFFREKLDELHYRLPMWSDMLRSKLRMTSRTSSLQVRLLSQIWQMNDHAASAYIPRPYPGVVTEFRPNTQYRMFDRPGIKWEDLARGGQEVVTLPVSPAGMLIEPFVRDLAFGLRASLDRAIAGERSVAGTDSRMQKGA